MSEKTNLNPKVRPQLCFLARDPADNTVIGAIVCKLDRHKNIIRLLEVFESGQHIFMVFEYASGGDVLDLVKKKLNGQISMEMGDGGALTVEE